MLNPHDNYNKIRRYFNKEMTKEEMHAFEKSLVKDPFLADAYEGFTTNKNEQTLVHLEQIKNKLTNNRGPGKQVHLYPIIKKWWNIAAILLLITGFSIIGYLVWFKPNAAPVNIAANKSPDKQEGANANKPLLTDANADVFTNDEQPALLATNENKIKPVDDDKNPNKTSRNKSNLTNKTDTFDEASASTLAVITDEHLQLAAPQSRIMKMDNAADEMPEKQYIFTGRVASDTGSPLPFAGIYAGNQKGAIADEKGNFKLVATDSVLEIKIVTPGYQPTLITINSNNPVNNIRLKELPIAGLAETVIGEIGRKKQIAASFENNILINQKSGVEPRSGWASFQKYLYNEVENLMLSNQNLNGTVIIEFKINAKGQPFNFNIVNAPDADIANLVMNLLKNGPAWTRNNELNTGKLEVIF